MESDLLAYPKAPELVIGIVAPIGTPLQYFKNRLVRTLSDRGFTAHIVKLSNFAASLRPHENFAAKEPYDRYDQLMALGNKLRVGSRDDVLALFAAAEINALRPAEEPRHHAASTFVIDQLKRPEEVYRFRRIYGEHFLLIGLYCPRDIRQQHLEHLGMSAEQAQLLIQRDQDDATSGGQRVVDTFHLSDVFVEVHGNVGDPAEGSRISAQLQRFWSLVLGSEVVTPTREEYGMYLAQAASLRSSSLARQVGAAVVSEYGEVISLGANDIPCYPGGLYWGDEVDSSGVSRDMRDHQLGFDESDRMKRDIVAEILPGFVPSWEEMSDEERTASIDKALKELKGTRITSLTEFARAVHAEMEALSAASRIGVSVRGSTLFTTTFPCHNCAKHIVAAGVRQVIYIEPYPKSRALHMYGDSIHAVGESPLDGKDHKVKFAPFVGVAPRRFSQLFGRYSYEGRQWEYKDKDTGEVQDDQLRLRIPFSPFSYVIREGLAAKDLRLLKERIDAVTAT